MSGSTFQPPINLDPHQDPSQQIAFINQNFQSLASSLNPYIVSDGTNNRIILGKQNDGTYGLKVSKAGVDVGTATNSQLIFNSNQDVFKITQSGTAVIPGGTTSGQGIQQSVDVLYSVNDGVKKAFMAYIADFNGNLVQLPAAYYYDFTLDTTDQLFIMSPGLMVYGISKSDRITFVIYGGRDSPTTQRTWSNINVKFYILQETAI